MLISITGEFDRFPQPEHQHQLQKIVDSAYDNLKQEVLKYGTAICTSLGQNTREIRFGLDQPWSEEILKQLADTAFVELFRFIPEQVELITPALPPLLRSKAVIVGMAYDHEREIPFMRNLGIAQFHKHPDPKIRDMGNLQLLCGLFEIRIKIKAKYRHAVQFSFNPNTGEFDHFFIDRKLADTLQTAVIAFVNQTCTYLRPADDTTECILTGYHDSSKDDLLDYFQVTISIPYLSPSELFRAAEHVSKTADIVIYADTISIVRKRIPAWVDEKLFTINLNQPNEDVQS